MKKIGWEGFTAGAVAGLVGALLVSEYSYSLFSVGIVGAIVGLIVAGIFKYFRK
jgi:hypothetical protein